MASKKKKSGVKRDPAEKKAKSVKEILDRIKADVDRFNALYSKELGDDLMIVGKAENKQERDILCLMAVANAHQKMLDCLSLTMFDYYDFHQDRQKKLHDRFEAKWEEMTDLEKNDTEDGLYYRRKVEEGLKQACGKYYSPYSERYEITIRDEHGNEIMKSKVSDDDYWDVK